MSEADFLLEEEKRCDKLNFLLMFSVIFSYIPRRNTEELNQLLVSVADFHEPDIPLSKKASSSPFTLLSPKYMGLRIKASSIALHPTQVHGDTFISCAGLFGAPVKDTLSLEVDMEVHTTNHTRNAKLLSMSLSQTEAHSCCFLLP